MDGHGRARTGMDEMDFVDFVDGVDRVDEGDGVDGVECTCVHKCTYLRGFKLIFVFWRDGLKKNFLSGANMRFNVHQCTHIHLRGVKNAIWVVFRWTFVYLCTYIRALQDFFCSEVFFSVCRCTYGFSMYTYVHLDG